MVSSHPPLILAALLLAGCHQTVAPVGLNNWHECQRPLPNGTVMPVKGWCPEYSICEWRKGDGGSWSHQHVCKWWGDQRGPGRGDDEQGNSVEWSPDR